jgi:beta-xylosidase
MANIVNFQIDIDTRAKLSEERLIWEGTGSIHPEGPHIYRSKGW